MWSESKSWRPKRRKNRNRRRKRISRPSYFLFKLQVRCIDAIAEASRFRAILEDVAEVRAAAGAMDFGAACEQAIVFVGSYVCDTTPRAAVVWSNRSL